jgi:ribosomal protein S1
MTPYKAVAMGIVLAVPLWAGFAVGQSKPSCDQVKAGAPQKVEGKVVRIDQAQGKVAVTETDGKTHEFQASKETLKDLKVGDNIEARLRELPKC